MRLLPFLLCLLAYSVFSQSYTVGTTSPLLADLTEMVGGNLVDINLWQGEPNKDSFDLLIVEKITQQNTSKELTINKKELWLNPNASISAVEKIAVALSELDTLNAESYQFNASVYREQLLDLETTIQEQIDALSPTQRLVVSALPEVEQFATQYGLIYEPTEEQTDFDETLCQNLADCPANSHYELLQFNADLLINYLQTNAESDTRNPTGWNNYWLLGGLVLLGAGIGLFAFMRKQ